MVQLGRRVWRGVVGVAAAAVVVGALVVVPAPASAADPCGPGSNPIECENSKPGTDPSVWDITGAGDATIQGFATQMSVQPGGTIDFKVDTGCVGVLDRHLSHGLVPGSRGTATSRR